MPQRTNDFQELVALIQRLFAPHNAVVTTSAMVETASGFAREIDVLIEFETDLYPIRMAVEAKHLSRPFGTPNLEEYIGKYNSHDGITVDKVIIVAKSFTKTIAERAKDIGFELHTLKNLEAEGVGLFSKSQKDQVGGWWCSKEKERILKLKLFGKANQNLSDRYLTGTLIQNNPHQVLGSPRSWIENIVNSCLGKQIDYLYEEHSGEPIHPIVEIDLKDHSVSAKGFRSTCLRKIVLDFGERMRIPGTQSTLSELTNPRNEAKKITHEKGTGKNATVNIIYEEVGKSPSKLHLRTDALEVKKVVLKFDSKELDFDTVRNLVIEASNSW